MLIGKNKYFILFSLILISCDPPPDTSLHIVNNCDLEFQYVVSQDSILSNFMGYNDTHLENSTLLLKYGGFIKKAKPRSVNSPMVYGKNYWKKFVEESPNKVIYFFLFDNDKINNNRWFDLISKNLYSKRITVSKSELIDNDWFIEICK